MTPVLRSGIMLALLIIALAACSAPPQPDLPPPQTPASTAPPLATTVILGDRQPADLPAVRERKARIAAALQAPPFILLREDLAPRQDAAQKLVADDARVRALTRTTDGKPLRTEVMTVAEARAGDLPPALSSRCPPGSCDRVVLYVYPTNTTISAIVSDQGDMLDVQALADAQPEIPQDLADLAVQIAISNPQVAAAFEGLSPDAAMAAMSATKTALDNTSCERSHQLCVAPVFSWGNAALWTIVDLTNFSLVAATTWTEQGSSGRRAASEATLQDAAIAPLCETAQHIDRAGWKASYLLTSSDGLEIRDVSYNDQPILTSAKVVDWHVGYRGTDNKRVGFSDAIGCPVFSQAAVIPYSLPTISDTPEGGFALEIIFRSPNWPQPCNYQYVLRALFSAGELTILAENQGRGCGTSGIYHPVLRIEPPAATTIALWDGSALSALEAEGQAEWPAGGAQYFEARQSSGSLRITPVWGDAQLAYVYWTRLQEAEGSGDLPSIGQCCSLDVRQGPDQFIGPGNPEELGSAPVLWYVPRIENAERTRCWADMTLVDGMLAPQIWPCSSGVQISPGAADASSPGTRSASALIAPDEPQH